MTLSLCAMAHAESKTEVVVRKGLVKTTTAQGDSLVSPGQKAVLEANKKPQVAIQNQLVGKLLELEEVIQKERAQKKIEIRLSTAQAYSVENENLWKVGVLVTMPNNTNQAETVCRLGPTTLLDDMKFFDLDGSSLACRIEKIEERKGYCHLTFSKAVQPGEFFRFIMITDFQPNTPQYQLCVKKDGQWIISSGNDTPRCLNFFYVILPKKAIFVKSEPQPAAIEEINGQVAITIRNYTGEEANGHFQIYFLWPEKDGACLKGIPWDKAGPEAVKIYDLFIREDIQSPELWGELAIKLVGGRFYEQAYDAFQQCFNGHGSAVLDYTALAWQGHLHDLWEQRQQAIEKYQQALKIKPNSNERHDQWGIILTQQWLQDRLQSPLTEQMLILPKDTADLLRRFEAIPWTDAGTIVLQFYKEIAEKKFEESQGLTENLAEGWAMLGLKLVGSGYMDEAMDCFVRCEKDGTQGHYLFIAIVWQGHLLDLKQHRQQAIEKYQQALAMKDDATGTRHDQWGIILTKAWVQERLKTPFSLEMLKK
jgi:tetratricopeptide (TPR) repeat protein